MFTGLAVFIILLLTLLALPVTVLYQVKVKDSIRGKIKLQWLSGLVTLKLSGFPYRKQKDSKVVAKKTRKITSGKLSRFMLASEKKLVWQRIVKFLRDLWRAIRKRDMHLVIRIGTGDPADTGRMWALLGPVSQLMANIKDATINIEPVFDEATFQLQSSGVVRIVPLQLLYLALGLILSPSLWKGLKR